MPRVKGIKEVVHGQIYDAIFVRSSKRLADVMRERGDERMIRFFLDLQNQSRLESNLTVPGALPSLNTFEARAMRVVVSTFATPRIVFNSPDIRAGILAAANAYRNGPPLVPATAPPAVPPATPPATTGAERDQVVTAIRDIVEPLIVGPHVGTRIRAGILVAADAYRNAAPGPTAAGGPPGATTVAERDRVVNEILDAFEAGIGAASSLLAELIYNSVTTLVVGEKEMHSAPSWVLPAGAGVSAGNGIVTNHGEPNPMAIHTFKTGILIEPSESFRVEMLFPQGVPGQQGTPGNLANVSGPLRIWVMVDGLLTRSVQ